MDSLNNAFASSDPKAAVMNQVRQEAAMTNARQLIEVSSYILSLSSSFSPFSLPHAPSLYPLPSTLSPNS